MNQTEKEKIVRFQKIKDTVQHVASHVPTNKNKGTFLRSIKTDVNWDILSQTESVQKESGVEVEKAQKEMTQQKKELCDLETNNAKYKQNRKVLEDNIRDIMSKLVQVKSTTIQKLQLIEEVKKELKEQEVDFEYYDTKRQQIEEKSIIELIFRPDITFPMIGKEGTYHKLWESCNVLRGRKRILFNEYRQEMSDWFRLNTTYQSKEFAFKEVEDQISVCEKQLMSISEKVVFWLEWYVLYGIFSSYLRKQNSLMELDRLISEYGEIGSLLASYEEVKEALEYWEHREEHSDYLAKKIKELIQK
ncbi:MAG: hypothetical protein RR769_05280 [Anaerovoracaceae bacterium]